MKKNLLLLAMAFVALCFTLGSCQEENNNASDVSEFVGVYDLSVVYDSVTTSDGVWFSEEFFETMTGKINPPQQGYLTIDEGQNGKLNVTATIVKDDGTEKVFFSTTATEKDGILALDNCSSDYYYDTTEEYLKFTFRNFANNMPEIFFKGVYTINLGYDYSYLNSYTCTKRR